MDTSSIKHQASSIKHQASSIKHQGFTLVEVIAALIVGSVLGSMMYSYFYSSMRQSAVPVTMLKRSLELHTVMENITADYNGDLGKTISDLKTKIGDADVNNPRNNSYGSNYYVIENKYIKFNDTTHEEEDISGGDPENILKVTIKNDGGTLTALFTTES